MFRLATPAITVLSVKLAACDNLNKAIAGKLGLTRGYLTIQ